MTQIIFTRTLSRNWNRIFPPLIFSSWHVMTETCWICATLMHLMVYMGTTEQHITCNVWNNPTKHGAHVLKCVVCFSGSFSYTQEATLFLKVFTANFFLSLLCGPGIKGSPSFPMSSECCCLGIKAGGKNSWLGVLILGSFPAVSVCKQWTWCSQLSFNYPLDEMFNKLKWNQI